MVADLFLIGLIICAIITVVNSIGRSRSTERWYQIRDADLVQYVKLSKNGEHAKADALKDKYKNDFVFQRHGKVVDRLTGRFFETR